jgi:hypothetical protein
MRVLWCAGLVAAAGCIIAAAAVAQDQGSGLADRCAAPLIAVAEAPDPQAYWDNDRQISVYRRQDETGSVYRIVGDIVELTPDLFPLLATAPGESLNAISEISIDAREIVVAMPLRLADGSIRLYADTVRFTGAGSLSLAQQPKEREQAVEIIASTLDLTRAPAMPFVLQTQGWVMNGTPAWPAADGSKRVLRIKARAIIPQSGASEASTKQLQDDPVRWVHNRTADQGFDSGFTKETWSAGYDITLGQGGADIYDALFNGSLFWPDATVAKLERLRARGGSDPAVAAFVRAKVEELTPRLARRTSQHALGIVASMRAADDLGIDTSMRAADDVAMTGLSTRLKNFQKSLDEVFGTSKKAGTLQLWDDARLAALTAGQMTDAAKQVDQVDKLLRADIAARAAIAARLASKAEQLLKTVQDAQAKLAEAAGLEDAMLTQYNEEKAQALSFGRIVDDLPVNSTYLGSGRLAAAPYALNTRPAATANAAYYGTKEGVPAIDLPVGIRDMADRYQVYAATLNDFITAWKAADTHLAAATGHVTGKQKNQAEFDALLAGMRDAAAKAAELQAALPDGPVPSVLGINDYTSVDPERHVKVMTLVREATAATTRVGDAQAAIVADQARILAIDARAQALGAVREDLVALKALPKEDAARRQAIAAAAMRSRLLLNVARDAAVLRKGFYYTTGRIDDVPSQAEYPLEDAIAGQDLDPRHPERYDPAQMQAALEKNRADLNQYYERFAAGLAERAGTFLDKKPALPPSVEFFRASYADDSGQDLDPAFERARFLDTLNRAIAAQIGSGRTAAGLASHPIRIPLNIAPTGPTQGAQFLLGAAITKVHFQDDAKPEGDIVLRLMHPRWGTVVVDGACHKVIDIGDGADGIETSFVTPLSLTRDVKPVWTESVSTDEAFAKILDNAFPLDAPYYATVEVTGKWSRPPVIDEIEIVLVKTGTHLQ